MVNAEFIKNLSQQSKVMLESLIPRLNRILGKEPEIFTDHSINHTFRVVEIVDEILKAKMSHFEELSNDELICLTASCLLHDIGMAYEIQKSDSSKNEVEERIAKTPKETREQHAQSASYLIKLSAGLEEGDDLLRLGLKNTELVDYADEIAWICRKHSGPVNEEDLERKIKIKRKELRSGLILCLLRLGDELDRTFERVNINLLDFKKIPPDSMLHWFINYYTKSITIDDGIISIGIRHPELPSPAPSRLIDCIMNKVKSEIDIVRLPLHKFGLSIQLDETDSDISIQPNLKSPPPEVLDLLVGRMDTPDQTNYPISPSSSNWIQHWGFNGNPWVDKLLGKDDELLIQTDSMNSLISETISVAKGKNGGLRLIVAQRRGGKTTLHRVLHDTLESLDINCHYIETLTTKSKIISGLDLYFYVLNEAKNIAEKISGEKTEDFGDANHEFRTAYEAANDNIVIFIDNLDRLSYEDENEKEIIIDFMKRLQNFTDQVQDKWYVLICVPLDWMDLLQEERFSYLRPELSHNLQSFNTNETWELISKRLLWAGKNISDVIDREATDKLCETSAGLPGFIIQNAELLFKRLFDDRKTTISGIDVDNHFSYKLSLARKRVALEAAQHDKLIEQGLSLFYLFQREIEKNQSDVDKYFRIIENSLERVKNDKETSAKINFNPIEISVTEFIKSLNLILTPVEEKISMGSFKNLHVIQYQLKVEIKQLFMSLELRGINSKTFVLDFSKSPIKPIGKNLDEEIKDYKSSIRYHSSQIGEIDTYLELSSSKKLPDYQRIMAAWNAFLECIHISSEKLKIDSPNFSIDSIDDPITLIQRQKQICEDWFTDVRNSQRIYFSTRGLYLYICNQVLSAAHFQKKGSTRVELNPDVVHSSLEALIGEFSNKFKF